MDRLQSMSVFVKAADLGSFTAAGSALGLSSQMVGKHIGFLEQRLGAQLLYRTTRRQSLTPIGQVFYERCRALLSEMEQAEDLVHELSATPRGRLRVTAPVNFGARAVAPLVASYLRLHPGVEVELTLTDRNVNVVDEGFDLAIRLGTPKDSGLASRELRPDRLVACAAPAYLARHGHPHLPDDLVAHECLTFLMPSGSRFATWEFIGHGKTHAIEVNSRFQVNDGRVLLAAALDGHGIILQPEAVVRDDLQTGRLVPVLPSYTTPSRPMHVLFSARRPQPVRLRRFIDMVIEAFGAK